MLKQEMRLYELFEHAWPEPDDLADDVIHRTVDLWRGIDLAVHRLGFGPEDIKIMIYYSRYGTVAVLAPLGNRWSAWALDGLMAEAALPPEAGPAMELAKEHLDQLLREAVERKSVTYMAPHELSDHHQDPLLTPEQNERRFTRAVFSGRVRLEKRRGRPVTADEVQRLNVAAHRPPDYLPWMGIRAEDLARELGRPRPTLVKPG
jgi:hypothetical protein